MDTQKTCKTCKYFRELFAVMRLYYGICENDWGENDWFVDHYKHVLSEEHPACNRYGIKIEGEVNPWEQRKS